MYKKIGKIIRLGILLLSCYLSFIPYAYALVEDTSLPMDEENGDAGDAAGEIVRAIEVRGLTRIASEELIGLMCFSVGDRLDRQALSTGVRRAFRKNIFQDIQVLSEPYDGGVKLTYLVREIPLVNKIIIKGNKNAGQKSIRELLIFKEGEFFKEELLDRARKDLLEFYKRKGYPEASVEIEVTEKEMKAVDIRISIEEGPPLIISSIDVIDDVRHIISVREGGSFDKDRLDEDTKKIRQYYKDRDYINPVVKTYVFRDGELSITVFPGPGLEVEFINNSAISNRKLMKEIFFIENEEVSDELVSETADRLKRLYVSEGYYNAQIAAGVKRGEDKIKVSFLIYEGEKVMLKKIGFAGISIRPEALISILPLAESKPYNDNLLSDSRELIIRFYNALGHMQADVLEIKKEFQDDGTEISLEFVISEGPQTKIESVEISGNKEINKIQLFDTLNIKKDAPYNIIDIGDARRRVLSLYRRYGYMDVTVDVENIIDEHKASLIFKITENKPSIIGKIILSGNLKTKAKIINRELTLHEGDPYNPDEIIKIKQSLYSLGIFNEVSIDLLEPGIDKGDKIEKDMLVSLKEGKAGSVEVSLGYGDYEQVRGAFGINYSNLGGYNRQIGLRAELNSISKRYILSFREPWLFNWPNVPLKLYLIREDKRAINIETGEVLYEIDKQSFIAGVEKEIAKGLKVGLDYEYSFTDTKGVQDDVILSTEDTGTLGISSISPSIFYDTRDDPFNPASGALQGIVVKYASRALLSETEFIKGFFQSSWYVQLLKPVILAFSLKGGAAYGFEETEEIPLIERFFLGGRTTVRGYSYDSLGPKGKDDNPTGGNVFALTNWELRFALGKGFGLVTFIDAGNVWKKIDDVSDELKYTTGAGLRYNTPVGPIRVDYGHKMNREDGESAGEVHFSFGHAF